MTTSTVTAIRGELGGRRLTRKGFVAYRGAAHCAVAGCIMHARWLRRGRTPICDSHRAAALRGRR